MLLDEINKFIQSYAAVFSLFTFLVGLYAGNKMAIGRDKRIEFNEAAIPIRQWLLHEIENPSPITERPTIIEIDQFVQRLPWCKRRCFQIAYERQNHEREKAMARDDFGSVSYENKKHIIEALSQCLRYTVQK